MTPRPSTDAIWTLLSSDLRAFLRRRVSTDEIAEDLLQETFVRIHRNIDSLTDTHRLVAWVYQIARNIVFDHYRTRSDTVALLDDAIDDRTDRSEKCFGAEKWLTELISQLPEKYREPVRLSELEGVSHQMIADRVGLSLSATKSRVQRGRALLKQVLLGCCHFEMDRLGNVIDYVPRPDRTVCRDCDET